MNNMHLCGWTLNAKPVSCVSREANATVANSQWLAPSFNTAKSLPCSEFLIIERESRKLLFFLQVCSRPVFCTRCRAMLLATCLERVWKFESLGGVERV